MDAELKTKWLEALRSGKYTQGTSQLRSTKDEYCCLGVLCNVIDPEKWVENHNENYCWGGRAGFVPDITKEQIGLNKPDENHLAEMNDMDMASFSNIADYIEQNL